MSFVTIPGQLGVDIGSGAGAINVNYPPGTTRGDFLNGVNNAITIGQNLYKAPAKCTFALGAAFITVTNKSGVTWRNGENYVVQCDVAGGGGQLSDNGRPMPRVQPWYARLLNLGSPLAVNASGLRVAAAVAAAGAIPLLLTTLDVPRNITIQSTGNDVARTFTITSNDVLGKPVVETMLGANIGTVTGKKAHYSNIVISIDGAAAANVNIGWGTQLGLPTYVPGTANIIKELQDGAVAGAGVLTVGDQSQPTGTTGDVRGTYVPAVVPDGIKGYAILVFLPDPGYGGADQFTG